VQARLPVSLAKEWEPTRCLPRAANPWIETLCHSFFHLKHDSLWAANLSPAPLDAFWLDQRKVGYDAQPLFECDSQFDGREASPEAAMPTRAKRQMEVRFAVEFHDVGIYELLRVSIGRSERQDDAFTGLDGATVQFYSVFGDAGDGHRCIHPQQLLDRSTEQFRFGGQPGPVFRVRGQVPDTGSDDAPRRVCSGEQDQQTASQLVLSAKLLAGNTWQLNAQILMYGPKKARELLLLAEEFDGRTAAQLGLVNRSVPEEELEATVESWAQRIAKHPKDALVMGKAVHQMALDSLGYSQQFWRGYVGHSLSTNIKFDPEDFNFLRERSRHGTRDAFHEREEHFER
jgi:Enoyl-CoA hydratase/isomerase